ncbi:hypothetical protein ABTZ03_34355 [Kitasatospora sp. NPDC096077]|uniref:hypothetical protein n=1 Tax=Kitasatospora sp. NPDC096077 TaxID=3155544 RepID=UPI00332FAC7A
MSDDHGRAVEEWLQDLPLLVARLEQVHLPEGTVLDHSPESLAAVERALVDQPGGADEDFARAAAAYVGEVLMGACGGRWGWEGEAVVLPDPALGLAPLRVGPLVHLALASGSGRVFTEERLRLLTAVATIRATDPDWAPHKEPSPLDPLGPQPDDPALATWLRERRAAFPAWADDLPGGRSTFDFSLTSLDALEREVRLRHAVATDPFLTGAVWYLGQVVCRHSDSEWLHWPVDPTAEPGSHHHPDNPWSGIPFTHQPLRRDGLAFNPSAELHNLVRFGDGYHLRNVVPAART